MRPRTLSCAVIYQCYDVFLAIWPLITRHQNTFMLTAECAKSTLQTRQVMLYTYKLMIIALLVGVVICLNPTHNIVFNMLRVITSRGRSNY